MPEKNRKLWSERKTHKNQKQKEGKMITLAQILLSGFSLQTSVTQYLVQLPPNPNENPIKILEGTTSFDNEPTLTISWRMTRIRSLSFFFHNQNLASF